MLGLQSNHYWITKKNFSEDKLDEVKRDVEVAQAEILDTYPDDDFLKLIRNQDGWMDGDGRPVPEYKDVDLSHSRMILFRYIFKHRPSLQDAFRECEFYKRWQKDVES